MVGDDPLGARVGRSAELAHRAQRVPEQVGLVDGVDALQQAGDPLQAEPDVDVVLRQRAAASRPTPCSWTMKTLLPSSSQRPSSWM